MTWFKVDDGLHSHRKVMSIPRRDRVAAMGLWVLAGSWCADNLTDGHVPRYMLTEWAATTRQARALCVALMWVEVDDGYQFHEWNHAGRQPTRAEVEANRESERKRKADWRARQEMSQRDTSVSPNGTDGGTPPGVPAGVRTPRPDPTRPIRDTDHLSSLAMRLGDGPDLAKIARTLGSDLPWAHKVATQVLERAPHDVRNPTAYIEQAIRERPEDYKPTRTPPALADLCDEHGRERATCPPSWHQ